MASGGEDETDLSLLADSSDEMSDEQDLNKCFNALAIIDTSENRDGKWLPHHPWEGRKPDPDLKMKNTIAISTSYPLKLMWGSKSTKKKQSLDLSKIFSNLSTFVKSEMQGSINGSREELEELVEGYLVPGLNRLQALRKLLKLPPGHAPQEIDQVLSNLPPHTRELFDKFRDDSPNDQKSLPVRGGDKQNKAISIQGTIQDDPYGVYLHIDCEYMLKMFMPESLFSWFDVHTYEDIMGQVQYQMQKISDPNKEKRWIFIPSFRRAQIALLDWPKDDIVTKQSTIIILVVRPSEFKEYVKCCGHSFPVICLPQDEIGAGYPRYWIQKIALRLKLQYIWMIDDSVECFYEYHSDVEPPLRHDKDGKWRHNYRDFRRRRLGLVFKRIEDLVKEADDSDKPIAAMSPRRWNPKCKPKQPFVCKPPQGAVYLNLKALSEKNVYYRPELKFLEDMIFGYECEKKGLKVYMDNRVHMRDHHWKHTGARSPSVQNQGNLKNLACCS